MTQAHKINGTMGILTFVVKKSDHWSAPWTETLQGEPRGMVLATGIPLLLGELLRLHFGADFVPAFVAEPHDRGQPRIPTPTETADAKRLADSGRERGFRWYLSGELRLGESSQLQLELVDCNRRTAAAALELDLPMLDLCAWVESILRWLATTQVLGDCKPEELVAGTTSSAALEYFLRAIRESHITDTAGRAVRTDRIVSYLADSLHEDPTFFAAASALVLFVHQSLLPQELDYLRRVAPQLLIDLQDPARRRGDVVLALAPTLMAAVSPKEVIPVLELPLDREFEPGRLEMLARTYRLVNERDRAVETARTAAKQFPNRVSSLAVLAELLEADAPRVVHAEAQGIWQQVLQREPEHTRALESRIRGLAETDADAGVELAERALNLETNWRMFDAMIASVRRASGPALESFAQRLSTFQLANHAAAVEHGHIGLLLYAAGVKSRAENHFTVALDMGLAHPYAARIHALQSFADDWQFADQFEVAAHSALQEDAAAALPVLEEICESKRSFWPARFLLGFVRDRAKDREGARADLQVALTESKQAPEVLFHLAVLERESANLDVAEGHIVEAIRRSPKNHSFWLELAEISFGKNDRSQAEQALENVLRLRPGHRRGTELFAQLRDTARSMNATQ